METVYLALGGNSDHADLLFQQAYQSLQDLALGTIQRSHLYRTAPIDCLPMADFLNAACRFETHLKPEELFQGIEDIERRLGKSPKPKNGARPLDIDLI